MSADFQDVLNKLYIKAHPSSTAFLTQETYFLAIESAFNMVVITDIDGVIHYANPAVERITGYSRSEIVGRKVGAWGGLMNAQFYTTLWRTIKKGKTYKGELQNHRKNGEQYMARLTISPIKKNGVVIGFIGTEEDITIEKKLQMEKEEFISLASHQLRTPLGTTKWNLELLLENNPQLKNELDGLVVQNELMIDLVNKFLIVLRIGDNKLVLRKEKINISQLVEEVVSHMRVRVGKLAITISIKNPDKDFFVSTDPHLLGEIITNVLDNAIKFSKNKGNILISFDKKDTHWFIQIKDSGIGIEKRDIPKIFNKFFRGSNTVTIPGSGLGMYIVNTYVHMLKGAIKVNSQIKKGSQITCTFPI
jgi:two-component system phosphate regulon sensor histidine kinase PhoR